MVAEYLFQNNLNNKLYQTERIDALHSM